MYGKTFPKFPRREMLAGSPRKFVLVRERETDVTCSHDTAQLSLQAQLKPAWLVMKAFGLLPIFSVQPAAATGSKRFTLFARHAAYPAGVFLAVVALACRAMLYFRAEYIKQTMSTTRIVYMLMYAVCTVPPVLIAPLLWARMGQVLSFFKEWDAFQARFLKVTRHPLRLNMRRLATVVIVLVLTGSTVVCLALHVRPLSRGRYLGSMFYFYAMNQINLLLAVWVLLCHASAKAADQLARRLQEEFQKKGAVGDHVVNGYHRVWLLLSKLTRNIGTIFSSVFNVIIIMWLTELLLAAFQGAKLVVNDCSFWAIVSVAGFALMILCSIQIFCHTASIARDAVTEKFKNSLITIQVEKSDIQRQLENLELSVSVHDAVISLDGYYDVNRSLVVSILSAFSTFLVVLFQSMTASGSDVCGSGLSKPLLQNGTKL